MFDGSCSNWYVRCDDPDAEKPVWTEPVYIGFGASLNKPIVRKNGEWILPVSLWERWHIDKPFADCYRELDAVRGANVFVSDDEGGHWRYRGRHHFQGQLLQRALRGRTERRPALDALARHEGSLAELLRRRRQDLEAAVHRPFRT